MNGQADKAFVGDQLGSSRHRDLFGQDNRAFLNMDLALVLEQGLINDLGISLDGVQLDLLLISTQFSRVHQGHNRFFNRAAHDLRLFLDPGSRWFLF